MAVFSSSFSLLYIYHASTPKFLKFPTKSRLDKSFEFSSPASLGIPPTILPPIFSNSPIFLPFLQDNQNPKSQKLQDHQETEEQIGTLPSRRNNQDPIFRFFEDRLSNPEPDPGKEGKFSLKKGRKPSWHLNFDSDIDSSQEDEEIQELEEFQVGSSLNASSSPSSNSSESEVGGVVGEILKKARNLGENVRLGEVLDFEGEVNEKDCVEALELMGEEGLIMGCLQFFEWMRSSEPSLLSPRAYSVLFPILGEALLGDEIMLLFRNLPKEKRYRDVHVYNSAVSGLLCCKRYGDSWKIVEDMEINNIQPDSVTCSIMITLTRKMGRSSKDAWELFERMNRKGVNLSLEVFGALIKSFCQEGLRSEALIIQSEMEKKGIRSNAVIYNTIMDSYSKSNQIEEAEGLFAEMKVKGISPTSASYNILMDAYSRRTQPEIVEKLMQEMKNSNVEPNVKSYTCLISAYGRQKKMADMAADAFLRMKRVGIKPTSHSYTALIHAYSASGWHEKAYMSFEDMQKEGIRPSIETYTALLDAFRRSGDTEMLMKIWKMMLRDKVEGTRVTFNILLDGFAKQGQYVEARDVIFEFGKLGFQPTVMTYNMLMNAYARGGQESKLPQLLKDMAALDLKPDSITYFTMIYAYVRVRDFRRAFYYHKQMVKSGQVPDKKSYEKLRAILDVKAAIKNKKDKSALMGIVKNSMGLLKQKKKGKKDEFWKYRKAQPRLRGVAKGRS